MTRIVCDRHGCEAAKTGMDAPRPEGASGHCRVGFLIKGHAGFAQPGEEDVVCAGISMLVCTLSECLEEYETMGYVQAVCRKIDPGNVDIAFYTLDHRATVSVMLDTILTGFRLLQEKYPENVVVEMK